VEAVGDGVVLEFDVDVASVDKESDVEVVTGLDCSVVLVVTICEDVVVLSSDLLDVDGSVVS
jgi:hypothetical protein